MAQGGGGRDASIASILADVEFFEAKFGSTAAARAKIEAQEQEIAALRREAAELRRGVAPPDREAPLLRLQVRQLQRELEGCKDANVDLRGAVVKLQLKARKLEDRAELYKDQTLQLQTNCRAATIRTAALRVQLDEALEKAGRPNELVKQVKEMERQIDAANLRNSTLRGQVSGLRKSLETAETHLVTLRARHSPNALLNHIQSEFMCVGALHLLRKALTRYYEGATPQKPKTSRAVYLAIHEGAPEAPLAADSAGLTNQKPVPATTSTQRSPAVSTLGLADSSSLRSQKPSPERSDSFLRPRDVQLSVETKSTAATSYRKSSPPVRSQALSDLLELDRIGQSNKRVRDSAAGRWTSPLSRLLSRPSETKTIDMLDDDEDWLSFERRKRKRERQLDQPRTSISPHDDDVKMLHPLSLQPSKRHRSSLTPSEDRAARWANTARQNSSVVVTKTHTSLKPSASLIAPGSSLQKTSAMAASTITAMEKSRSKSVYEKSMEYLEAKAKEAKRREAREAKRREAREARLREVTEFKLRKATGTADVNGKTTKELFAPKYSSKSKVESSISSGRQVLKNVGSGSTKRPVSAPSASSLAEQTGNNRETLAQSPGIVRPVSAPSTSEKASPGRLLNKVAANYGSVASEGRVAGLDSTDVDVESSSPSSSPVAPAARSTDIKTASAAPSDASVDVKSKVLKRPYGRRTRGTAKDEISPAPAGSARSAKDVLVKQIIEWPSDRRNVISLKQSAMFLTLKGIEALEKAEPWNDMFLRRPRHSMLFNPEELSERGKKWLKATLRIQFVLRREFWERLHWLPVSETVCVGTEWTKYRKARTRRASYAARVWRKLYEESIELMAVGALRDDVWCDPALWYMPASPVSWLPKSDDLLAELNAEDYEHPSRTYFTLAPTWHPFFQIELYTKLADTKYLLPSFSPHQDAPAKPADVADEADQA